MPIDHFSDVQIYNIHCYSFSQVFLSVLSLFFLCSSSTPFPGGGGGWAKESQGKGVRSGRGQVTTPPAGGRGRKAAGWFHATPAPSLS
jgi:hypothetical protein